MKSKLVFAGLFVMLSALGAAQSETPDTSADTERLQNGLKATKLNFEKSASGLSFTVDFRHEPNTRRVYVGTVPSVIRGLHCHTIYTTVWSGNTPPTAEMLQKLIYTSKKTGNFYTFKDTKGGYAIRFGANFNSVVLAPNPGSEDAAVKNLADLIYFVDQVGEEAAKLVSGG